MDYLRIESLSFEPIGMGICNVCMYLLVGFGQALVVTLMNTEASSDCFRSLETCFGIKVNTTIGFEFWSLALVSADGLLWVFQVPITLDFFLT